MRRDFIRIYHIFATVFPSQIGNIILFEVGHIFDVGNRPRCFFDAPRVAARRTRLRQRVSHRNAIDLIAAEADALGVDDDASGRDVVRDFDARDFDLFLLASFDDRQGVEQTNFADADINGREIDRAGCAVGARVWKFRADRSGLCPDVFDGDHRNDLFVAHCPDVQTRAVQFARFSRIWIAETDNV